MVAEFIPQLGDCRVLIVYYTYYKSVHVLFEIVKIKITISELDEIKL